MPNWCANNAEFYNEDVEKVNALEARLTKLRDEEKEPGLFGSFMPRPIEYDEGEKWYSWNVENWGTKWEVTYVHFERVDDNTLQLSFDTAWSPPTSFYEWLSINTSWYVTASYYEPGMCFIGRVVEGEDEFYQYSDIDSLSEIPEDLVEEYGLLDQMQDEEDNDEDTKGSIVLLDEDDKDEDDVESGGDPPRGNIIITVTAGSEPLLLRVQTRKSSKNIFSSSLVALPLMLL
jgi:hypothetical protein